MRPLPVSTDNFTFIAAPFGEELSGDWSLGNVEKFKEGTLNVSLSVCTERAVSVTDAECVEAIGTGLYFSGV